MNIYLTTGTTSFLTKIKEKYPNENLLLLEDGIDGLLIHETEGKTVFSSPREFEVIESTGSLTKPAFVVLNNIPISDEGKPIFEYKFKEQKSGMESVRGFKGLRLLKPFKGDTYIVISFWSSKDSFNNWKGSASFLKSHENDELVASSASLFLGPPTVNQYYLPEGNQ